MKNNLLEIIWKSSVLIKNVVGEKKFNLILSTTTTLTLIFNAIYYMSVCGVYSQNKFLLIGGIFLIVYFIISETTMIFKFVKYGSSDDIFSNEIEFVLTPFTTIYLLTVVWQIFNSLHS